MGDATFNRLIDAEKEAKSLVEKARIQARTLIERAEEEAQRERERRIAEFHNQRTQSLSSSGLEAQMEAEKIRYDGIEVARGLEDRLKSRIPKAVENVMSILLEGQ